MLNSKLKKIIRKFYNVKVVFNLPKKKDILLYDKSHSLTLKEIIKKDFNIIDIHKIEIYFWIFLKQIFLFDFTLTTYYKNYISYTTPKIVISFNDVKLRFYELKDFRY